MPKINKILLKLEVFQYDTSLDLNMGYYHIQLTEDASNLCTIVILWVKQCYKHLPMVVSNSMEKFQQKIDNLFH